MADHFRFRSSGFSRVQANANLHRLAGPPLRLAFEEAALTLEVAIAGNAPREKGGLARRTRSTIDKSPLPRWARVETGGEKPWKKKGRAFRYGWALNFSKKRPFRYRSGKNKGQLTYLWFSRTVVRYKPMVMDRFLKAVNRIAALWRT